MWGNGVRGGKGRGGDGVSGGTRKVGCGVWGKWGTCREDGEVKGGGEMERGGGEGRKKGKVMGSERGRGEGKGRGKREENSSFLSPPPPHLSSPSIPNPRPHCCVPKWGAMSQSQTGPPSNSEFCGVGLWGRCGAQRGEGERG